MVKMRTSLTLDSALRWHCASAAAACAACTAAAHRCTVACCLHHFVPPSPQPEISQVPGPSMPVGLLHPWHSHGSAGLSSSPSWRAAGRRPPVVLPPSFWQPCCPLTQRGCQGGSTDIPPHPTTTSDSCPTLPAPTT